MYTKIAFNNVKKSLKDYTIYFLTLSFAVCIFYAFNSIGNQKAMKDISENTATYIEIIRNVISGVSLFVSFILGILIIYANNFLIKRRKSELGMYMILGMGKRKISQILVTETFSIGLISLVIGLGFGIVLSQGLSIFTTRLFNLSLSQYIFSISIDAIIKTIIYFGVIFLLVMILNVLAINKYKLIDLIMARRKNEKVTMRNPIVLFIIFIAGIVSLGRAYYLILNQGTDVTKASEITTPLFLGGMGTFLFFFGISGFLLYVIKKNKNIYLKGLNIFVVKQISSKINTNFISISIISLMLFVTIVSLSAGLGLKNVLEKNFEATTPFDATLQLVSQNNKETISEALKKSNISLPKDFKTVAYNTYDSKLNISKMTKNNLMDSPATVMSISDYNNIMKLEGKPTVNLKSNEVLITSNFNLLEPSLNEFIKSGKEVTINNKDYIVKNQEVLDRAYRSIGMTVNICTIIVPDDAIKGLNMEFSYMDIIYGDNRKGGEEFINDLRKKYGVQYKNSGYDGFLLVDTKINIYETNNGVTSIILFITIYLGVIFLLTSAVVLALQQLSEASDSVERYKALKKISVTQEEINKTIFFQTLVYFGAPLSLAIVDSIVGLNFVNKFVKIFGRQSIMRASLMTFMLLVIIYLGYFIATYASYKNTINSKR